MNQHQIDESSCLFGINTSWILYYRNLTTTGSFSFVAERVYSYRRNICKRSYYELRVSVVTDVTWGFGVWCLDHFKWNEIGRRETDGFHEQRIALIRMQSLASAVLENLFNVRVSFLVWRHFINLPSDVLMRRAQDVCEAVQDSHVCFPDLRLHLV